LLNIHLSETKPFEIGLRNCKPHLSITKSLPLES
jgi:hypothetical protein